MKRLFFTVMLAIAVTAGAQTPTVTTPQSVESANFFNGVSTAQTSSSFQNLGQTVHFLFYQGTGATGTPSGVQIRLDASSDGVTYFPISDDGTDPPQGLVNVVLAIGPYPFVRANLVKCTGCDANNTITASYFGTSSMPGNPFGTYGAGQQVRKIAFVTVSTDASTTSTAFNTPYGSTAGFLVVHSNGAFAGTATISVRVKDFSQTVTVSSLALPTTGALNMAIPIPATSANTVDVRFTHVGGVSGNTFSTSYIFLPPGTALPAPAQPGTTSNTEATSAANAAVTTTLTVNAFQRAHLFNVNAKCSAGTAQLTVADGATTIWSSAATEVGTTSFTKFWNPGLSSSGNNNLVITLGTCGVANTGTLDVQGSVF